MTARQRSRYRDGATRPIRGRRYPRLAAAFTAAAALVTVLMISTDIASIPLGDGGYLGAVLLFVPAVLLLAGCIAAAVDESIGTDARIIWGVVLGLLAVVFPSGFWMIGVLIGGP
jgi:hypothetical protein